MNWKENVDKKHGALVKLIRKKWLIRTSQLPLESERCVVSYCEIRGLLTAKELTITGFTVQELARKIAFSEYRVTSVCRAYYHRAAIAHQFVNCLAELGCDSAFEQAMKLDEYFQEHGRTMRLLHGEPVSLKDQCRVKEL